VSIVTLSSSAHVQPRPRPTQPVPIQARDHPRPWTSRPLARPDCRQPSPRPVQHVAGLARVQARLGQCSAAHGQKSTTPAKPATSIADATSKWPRSPQPMARPAYGWRSPRGPEPSGSKSQFTEAQYAHVQHRPRQTQASPRQAQTTLSPAHGQSRPTYGLPSQPKASPAKPMARPARVQPIPWPCQPVASRACGNSSLFIAHPVARMPVDSTDRC
jgi:hypothetical protein